MTKDIISTHNKTVGLIQEALIELRKAHLKDSVELPSRQVIIYGTQHKGYHIYSEPNYHVIWIENGVAEFGGDFEFVRYIEFNKISINDIETILGKCYCEGNAISFLTASSICKSIAENASLFCNSSTLVSGLGKQAEIVSELLEALK